MRASIDRTVAVMLTILVLGTYAFGGLLDGIKKGVSDISDAATKTIDNVGKPTDQPSSKPQSPEQAKSQDSDKIKHAAPKTSQDTTSTPPASEIPQFSLSASQAILDATEVAYKWNLSPSLYAQWKETLGGNGANRDSDSLSPEDAAEVKSIYKIRPDEKLLRFSDLVMPNPKANVFMKSAISDKATYLICDADTYIYKPQGILRIPHSAAVVMSSKPEPVPSQKGLMDPGAKGLIFCEGKPILYVEGGVTGDTRKTGSEFFNWLAELVSLNRKFYKLSVQEAKASSLPEITDMTGYKGVKAETSYKEAQELLSPQLSEDYFEFEFVQKFWTDESWQNVMEDSFKGAFRSHKEGFAPELQFKQDPFDNLSFPFIWHITGFSYADKTGRNKTYFIDDKFYSFNSVLNEEFAAKGQAIAQSMSKKYGQPLWEVANSSKQESRCVWENENGAIIATFEGGWSQPPWLFVGSALSYAATNGLSCDYTVLSYGLADGPVKKDTAVRFKALWFNKINDMDFAVPEIPANGRVLVIGFAMKIKEAAKAKKHGMEEEVETVTSLIQRYNMFAQRDPDDPRLPGLKDRIEKAKVDAVKQQAEGEGKLRLEGNARDELFAKMVILDDKNKEHKMTGSFSCDYQKINYMAFCEVPADSKRFLLVTPDGKRVVIEPVQSSWHFLGPLDLTVLNENRFKLTKIDYFSKTMRQYVENKIEKLKNEGKKQAETLKKQEAGEVQGF